MRRTRRKGGLVLFLLLLLFLLRPMLWLIPAPKDLVQHKATIKNNTTTTSSSNNNKRVVVYNAARTDRAGEVISSMLAAHAYTHNNKNWEYGGACEVPATNKRNYTRQAQWDRYYARLRDKRKDQERLIHALGLERVLRFACPTTDQLNEQTAILLDKEWAYGEGNDTVGNADVYTAAWQREIRSLVNYDNNNNNNRKTVAVHVRRGDVSPCKNADRYSPNAYFLAVLDRYLSLPSSKNNTTATPYDVSIYSERDSMESFDVFRDRNYTLHLEEDDLPVVWKAFLSADVLVMGRSSFSYVPALLKRNGQVLFLPYKRKPLPDWTMVDDDLVQFHDEELERLVAAMCQ